MSEIDDLRQVIETNFRLSALQFRELSVQVHGEMADMGREVAGMGQEMAGMGRELKDVGRKLQDVAREVDVVSSKAHFLGNTFKIGMEQQADRHDETLSAMKKILDHSIDLHKTAADHEHRIRRLEERAS